MTSFPAPLHDLLISTLDLSSLPPLSGTTDARIAPALRLATLFLYVSHRFLWKVLYGAVRQPKGFEWVEDAWVLGDPVAVDENSGNEEGGAETVLPYPETAEWLTSWIKQLGRRLHMVMGPRQEKMGCEGDT